MWLGKISQVFAKMLKIPPPIFDHLSGKLGNLRLSVPILGETGELRRFIGNAAINRSQ
jgi:hypothetical protein